MILDEKSTWRLKKMRRVGFVLLLFVGRNFFFIQHGNFEPNAIDAYGLIVVDDW